MARGGGGRAVLASRFVLDAATRNFTIKRVTGPDEGSGMVDDEAYTNAIAAATLSFAIEAAAAVGASASVGSNWSAIAARPYLPVVTNIFDGSSSPNLRRALRSFPLLVPQMKHHCGKRT